MASEDSDQVVPGFAVVHRLRDLRDLDETLTGQVSVDGNDLHTTRERFEVVALRGAKRVLPEERDDGPKQLLSTSDVVLAEVLTMVVVPAVHVDAPDSEEALELLETSPAPLALRHDEPVKHLVSGRVASSPRAVWLPHEADREASFSVYETDHPATELDQSFLLVFRTRHVVTMVDARSDATR
jgi:hypothetical protein